MSSLSLTTSYVDAYLSLHPTHSGLSVQDAHKALQNRTCQGADYLGWIDLPSTIRANIADIQETAERLRAISDVLIVCGIGGSYLGARAIIEALGSSENTCEIVFLGNHLS
ncbi:MAG: hypothetical protein WCK88_01185 [bacterium]